MLYSASSKKQKDPIKTFASEKNHAQKDAYPEKTPALLSEEIKSHLYLPPLESVDPLVLFNRMFREAFQPSNPTAAEHITTASMNKPEQKSFYRKFSYICFERGHLAASVLKDEGKILLTAAIEKAIAPIKLRESKHFSLPANIEGIPQGSTAFYNDCTSGACSLALDASKSASEAIEALKTAIEADNTTGTDEMKTLEYILPFISHKREFHLISGYRKEIDELKSISMTQKSKFEKEACLSRIRALNEAISKLHAIANKKDQFRQSFLSILDNAWNRIIKFQNDVSVLGGEASGSTNPSEGIDGSSDGDTPGSREEDIILAEENKENG